MLFFVFCATLCFAIVDNVLALIVGIVTLLNVIFNMYVMCKSPEFHKAVQVQEKERLNGAVSTLTKKQEGKQSHLDAAIQLSDVAVTLSNNSIVQDVAKAEGKRAMQNGQWEKFMDEDTGTPYWYNKQTKETSFSQP